MATKFMKLRRFWMFMNFHKMFTQLNLFPPCIFWLKIILILLNYSWILFKCSPNIISDFYWHVSLFIFSFCDFSSNIWQIHIFNKYSELHILNFYIQFRNIIDKINLDAYNIVNVHTFSSSLDVLMLGIMSLSHAIT